VTSTTIPQVSCDEVGSDGRESNEQIARFVRAELAPLVPEASRIITFDGFDGVGKSTLARHLAALLKLPLIQLDDFLVRNQDRFLEAIDFPRFTIEISTALKSAGRVVVEGCLVEAALDRINRASDFRFYVMRTNRMHANPRDEWTDEYDVLYGDESTEELIGNLEHTARQWAHQPKELGGGGDGKLPPLERELIYYHRNKLPREHANAIIKIVRWDLRST